MKGMYLILHLFAFAMIIIAFFSSFRDTYVDMEMYRPCIITGSIARMIARHEFCNKCKHDKVIEMQMKDSGSAYQFVLTEDSSDELRISKIGGVVTWVR